MSVKLGQTVGGLRPTATESRPARVKTLEPKQNASKAILRCVPDDTVRPAQRLRLPVIHWETVDDAFAYSNMSFLSWLNPSRQSRKKKLPFVNDSQ